MDSIQILNIFRNDQVIQQIFNGVYPIDKLPKIPFKPAALIINLDTSKQPGSHWVCLYFDKKAGCEYFDSYGRTPSKKLINYMRKYATKIKYSKKCVQQLLTATCGQYCVYYLTWRCRGVYMKDILKSLNKEYADEFVTGFINGLFKVNTEITDERFLQEQWNNFT